MTAGDNNDTNDSRGYSSGQPIPITPAGSFILTVQPYSVVSYGTNEGINEKGPCTIVQGLC